MNARGEGYRTWVSQLRNVSVPGPPRQTSVPLWGGSHLVLIGEPLVGWLLWPASNFGANKG
jgi:hypothetical protein